MQPRMPLVAFGPQPWEMAYPFHGSEKSANGQGGKESNLEILQGSTEAESCKSGANKARASAPSIRTDRPICPSTIIHYLHNPQGCMFHKANFTIGTLITESSRSAPIA